MTKQKNPKLHELKQRLAKAKEIQVKIEATIQRGLKSTDPAVAAGCVRHARTLALELAGMTWDSLAIQMHLAQELPSAIWTKPGYYYAAELRQWAKVHALPTGRFIFEAIGHDGQGVLAEVGTFQFLAPWQASTATEYRAMLTHLLDTNGVQWNKVPAAQAT